MAFVEFDEVNFFDAAFVAATGEGCAEEGLDHFNGLRAVDDASAERQNVGVIVFAGEFRGADIVGECSADAGNFVGRDGIPIPVPQMAMPNSSWWDVTRSPTALP